MAQPISNLPVGALVKDITTKYYGSPIIWVIADKNHAGYPANSVTLLSKYILTLKCPDAKEPSNSNSTRRDYGNNRYLYSNIRQWLNSATGAGAWYTAQHSADAPPTNANVEGNYNEYDAEAGFQNDFSANFRNALLSTSLTVVKPSVDGGGAETVVDKVFLLSNTEVGLADEDGIAEGSKLALFSDDTSRLAYPTALCVSNSEYTSTGLKTDLPWHWWLRTPYASNARRVRRVSSNGSSANSSAFCGIHGIRPACNLPSSILVSDTPDEDGAYIIQWQTMPIGSLPVGAIVKSVNTKYNNSVIRFIIGHKTTDRVKLITEKIITLKCFDAKEPSNPNSDRRNYGNDRYSVSNIDQWLNSAADAGAWYSARHSYDAPPNNANVSYNEYDTEAGFLANFEESFRNAILDSTIRVAKNTVTDGGGYEDITRKVYLLSTTEVGLDNENGIAEGSKWDLFSGYDSRIAYPTVEAVSRSEYTHPDLNALSPWHWWLRTPHAGYSYHTRYVSTGGTLGSRTAYGSDGGVRPALELDSGILVSNTPDTDGAYVIQWGTMQPISNLPIGAIVKSVNTKYNNSVIRFVIGHKTADRVKLITEKIITLKCFDAKEPSNPNSDRRNYGNNRYSQSNIDQWLNSAAGAGAWYSAQHAYDAPPTNANVWGNYNEYDAEAGFLSNFEESFRNAILDTTIRVVKNTVTDGGGYEDITRKVYLLSNTEVGLPNESGIAEGSKWDLFSDDNSRKAYPTAEAVSRSEYTDSNLNALSPWYWRLRTPTADSSYNAWCVGTSGTLYGSSAYNGYRGVRPALELDSGILVSDTPDTDGAYIIQWGATLTLPNLKIYANGIKAYKNGWAKVNGQLKRITAMWTKINGQVKKI